MPATFLLTLLPLVVQHELGEDRYANEIQPASDEADQAIATFQKPDDLEVSLFAAEPMLANPVCLYVDHDGSIYVGETFRHHSGVTDIRSHYDWKLQDLANRTVEDRIAMLKEKLGEQYDTYAEHHDRIRVLRDTDGDGRADAATVFADGFTKHEAGIGAGLLSYEGSVYYTCIPDLWLLRDTDGDDVADEQRELSTGYGVNIAMLGHDLHGLRIGPDGRLYFSSGDRGFCVETEDGVLEHHHTGAVLRCELDGSRLEVVHTGLRNPQELVFDKWGNLWTGDNNSDSGDKARWVHVVPGGDSGWRYSYQWIERPVSRGPWNLEKLWHPPHEGQPAHIVPPVANITAGPSGLTYYPGVGLPARYDDHFFLVDFRGSVNHSGVVAFDVTPKGAFWEVGELEQFFWGCLVTDADFGPDGSFYALDWVKGWNKTGRGRIYELTYEGGDAELARRTARLLGQGFEGRSIDELTELLAFPDMRVRQEAQFELVDREADGARALVSVATGEGELLSRLHAVWGLGMLGRKWRRSPDSVPEEIFYESARLGGLLKDPEPEIRGQAALVSAEGIGRGMRMHVAELLRDENPRVAFHAALAMGLGTVRLSEGNSGTSHVTLLEALLDRAGEDDPNLRHAAVYALARTASVEQLLNLRSGSVHARVGAVIALRRQASPYVREYLKDSDTRVVLEAARAIHDLPIEEALPDLAAAISDLRFFEAPYIRRAINANFLLADALSIRRLAGFFAQRSDLDLALRVESIDALRELMDPPPVNRVHGRYEVREPVAPEALVADVERMVGWGIADERPELVTAWIRLIREVPIEGRAELLRDWALDATRPAGVRIAALEALEGWSFPGLPDVVRSCVRDGDAGLRTAALAVLERLDPEAAMRILPDALATGELEERRGAYRALGKLGSRASDELIAAELDRLRAGVVAAELTLDLVLAAEARSENAAIAERLTSYREPRTADDSLTPYLDALFGGDVEAGRKIFHEDQTLQCLRCHSVAEDPEGKVGPSLFGLGSRDARISILENIVEPNRRISEGFEATALFREVGGVVAGRILKDGEVIRVLKSDGEIEEVSAEDVTERRKDLSAMPEGLAQHLDRVRMRDLIAYLATL